MPGNPGLPSAASAPTAASTPAHAVPSPARRALMVAAAIVATLGTQATRPVFARPPSADASRPPLVNTYWRLLRLGGTEVPVADQVREPHLVLRPPARPPAGSDTDAPPGGRVAAGALQAGGSAGCNRFSARYEVHADRLFFHRPVSTRMGCTLDLMRQEAAFIDALERTARFRIDANRLILLDSQRNPLAVFEPRYLT